MADRRATRRSLLGATGGALGTVALGGCIESAKPESVPRPIARFEFEQRFDGPDASQGTLEVVHDSGDQIPVARLFVRGTGFADVRGADVTASDTRWTGTATASVDGQPAVGQGDRLVVGVRPDYVVKLVWTPSDPAESSARLARHTGPEA